MSTLCELGWAKFPPRAPVLLIESARKLIVNIKKKRTHFRMGIFKVNYIH